MNRWSRRAVLAGIAAPVLAGCSSDPNADTGVLTTMLAQSLDPFSSAASVKLEQVAAIPYATMGIRLGSSAQGILVLATSQGDRRLWTANSHIAIETVSGRIVTTANLPKNLSATVIHGDDPLARGLHRLGGPATMSRLLDFSDLNIYGATAVSRFAVGDVLNIDILGTAIRTVHVREECFSQILDWNFSNEYWADVNTGLIWKSVQYVHPALDAVELETLRPPTA